MLQHTDSESATKPQNEGANTQFDSDYIAQALLLHPKNQILGSDPYARPYLGINAPTSADKINLIIGIILLTSYFVIGLIVLEVLLMFGIVFVIGGPVAAWYFWEEYKIRRNLIKHGQVIRGTLIEAHWKSSLKRDLLIITFTFHAIDGNPVTDSKVINGLFWLKGKVYTVTPNPLPIYLRSFRIKTRWLDVVEVLTPGTPILILCDKNYYRFL